MSGTRQLIFGVCLAMVAAGLVRLLMPAGNFLRTAGTITALMMVASVIALLGGLGDFGLDLDVISPTFEPILPYTDQAQQTMEQAVVHQTKTYVESRAKQQGLGVTVQQVEVNWTEQKITVESITVTGTISAQQLQSFAEALSRELGVPVMAERTTNE